MQLDKLFLAINVPVDQSSREPLRPLLRGTWASRNKVESREQSLKFYKGDTNIDKSNATIISSFCYMYAIIVVW